jgi:hypothetical protein
MWCRYDCGTHSCVACYAGRQFHPGEPQKRASASCVINDIVILNGDRGPWASPPSKPTLDRDGVAMKDQRGKIRYSPLIEFTSMAIRDRWSAAVIDAMRAAHPEALS